MWWQIISLLLMQMFQLQDAAEMFRRHQSTNLRQVPCVCVCVSVSVLMMASSVIILISYSVLLGGKSRVYMLNTYTSDINWHHFEMWCWSSSDQNIFLWRHEVTLPSDKKKRQKWWNSLKNNISKDGISEQANNKQLIEVSHFNTKQQQWMATCVG